MEKKRVYTSFDFKHDEMLRNMLISQSKNPDSPFEIISWSMKEPMTEEWKEHVQENIRNSDLVIIICGEHTDIDNEVSAELKIAKEEKKPYFLLSGRTVKLSKKPKSAEDDDKIYRWTWDNLKELVRGVR